MRGGESVCGVDTSNEGVCYEHERKSNVQIEAWAMEVGELEFFWRLVQEGLGVFMGIQRSWIVGIHLCGCAKWYMHRSFWVYTLTSHSIPCTNAYLRTIHRSRLIPSFVLGHKPTQPIPLAWQPPTNPLAWEAKASKLWPSMKASAQQDVKLFKHKIWTTRA